MDLLDRRHFIGGAAALGATLGAEATAAGDPIAARVRAWRHKAAEAERDLGDILFLDRRPIDEDRDAVQQMGAGIGSLHILKEFEALPVEDQVHPDAQAAIAEALTDLGGALCASRDRLRAWLDSDQDPDDIGMRAALTAIRHDLSLWQTTVGRQRMLARTLAEAEAEAEAHPGALRRRIRRAVRRIDKVEAIAGQMADDPRSTGLLGTSDPAMIAAAQRGRAKWAGVSAASSDRLRAQAEQDRSSSRPNAEHDRKRRVMGLLVGGLLYCGGAVIVGIGACNLACGDPSGVLLLLAGIGVMALGIWVFRTTRPGQSPLDRRLAEDLHALERQQGRITGPLDRDADGSLSYELGEERVVLAMAKVPWTRTGMQRTPGEALVVRGFGVGRSPRGWATGPDGDGTSASNSAPLPGAPHGALIGQIEGEIFFIGEEGRVPDGPPGLLEVGLNLRTEDRDDATQRLGVQIGRFVYVSN